ncbi:hypothetical protein VNO77_39119 [Canavalia gladiata]|uniref:Essential protein Yae1 N-terminal domain-containing protein n=1 Tax=Canavalia gladiata TaxID=3824 RepID=A0AAN9KDV6_CANGL
MHYSSCLFLITSDVCVCGPFGIDFSFCNPCYSNGVTSTTIMLEALALLKLWKAVLNKVGSGLKAQDLLLKRDQEKVVNWVVMDDLFESSLNLEDTHYKEGYDEGYSHGLITGKEEARQVGLKVGFEVGEELGFYRGCVDIWTSAILVDPTCFTPRSKMIISQMEELIQKYPLMDPENIQVQEIMDSLRLKFKMVCSSLHVKLEYNGYPKSSSEANDIQF